MNYHTLKVLNNGEKELNEEPKSKVVQDLEKMDNFLDSYEQKIGIGNIGESNVDQYLNMNQDMLRKLSPEDCAEGAYILTQEALFVQHEINKHQAQMDWASARIAKTISGELDQYGGRFATFDTRKILAIKHNSYASELQGIVDKAQRIITRISYLPNKLHDLAKVLLDYRHTKLRVDKNETTRIA